MPAVCLVPSRTLASAQGENKRRVSNTVYLVFFPVFSFQLLDFLCSAFVVIKWLENLGGFSSEE